MGLLGSLVRGLAQICSQIIGIELKRWIAAKGGYYAELVVDPIRNGVRPGICHDRQTVLPGLFGALSLFFDDSEYQLNAQANPEDQRHYEGHHLSAGVYRFFCVHSRNFP